MRTAPPIALGLVAAALVASGCGDEATSAPPSVGEWERLPEPPLSPREAALGLWTGEEVLLIGGSDAPPCPPAADCVTPKLAPLRDGVAFDPATGRWRELADAPTAIHGADGVVLGRTAYIWVHGDPRRPEHERAFLEYRIADDRWERLSTPPAVADRYYALTATDDEVVLFRDSDEYGESPDLAYDPAMDRWREFPADPLSPTYDRALAWSGTELVLIAKDRFPGPNSSGPTFASAAALDPESGPWRELPDSDVLDMGLTGCWVQIGGRIVNPSVGGSDGGGRWDGVYPDGGVLDPRTGAWSDLPERPEHTDADRYGGGVLTGSEALCMSTEGWVLDAPAGEWLRMPRLAGGVQQGRTVVGTDNGAFAFGGAEWSENGLKGRLVREAWLWSSR
jgi:hypothetical protein